ncbi:MAG: glycolate oxidase subunit GlcF [Rhodomicrobium sp.]
MQTNFTLTQLADPEMARSERILRNCVHCGFCIATCPTYLLLGDELDSPRGRIYLMKDMMEKGRPADELTVKHIDRCLSCLSCMTTCPSGVDYMHLVDHARAYIEKTYKRPLMDRMMRSFMARVLPNPSLMRPSLRAAALAKPLGGLFKRLPAGDRIAALLELATFPSSAKKWETAPQGNRKGRVALLAGCAQSALQPSINQAAARVLTRHGIEVVSAKGEGCCGGLVHHMGRADDAHRYAQKNIDAWISEMDGGGLDSIVITTSGCGTTVKDYGGMFREDRDYAAKAKRVSAIAKDITEYLSTLALNQPARGTGQIVAYHSACSMQHGQKIKEPPKRLLAQMGFNVKDIPESHICCGSAGIYNIMQPQIASRLRARKVANIEKTKPEIIAAGNIGCIAQIGHGTALPIVHTVELIDWAQGGPLPAALADAGFKDRPASPVQGERPNSEAAMA